MEQLNPQSHMKRISKTLNGKIRISVVEPSGNLYGSEYCLLDILESLNLKVFQPEVILPINSSFSKHLIKIEIPCIEILQKEAHRHSCFRKIFSYLKMATHWLKTRPDLIYINQGGILRPVVFLGKRLNIPIICQIQTLEDAQWVSSVNGYHETVSAFICNSKFIAEHTKVSSDKRSVIYYGYKWKNFHTPRKTAPLPKNSMEIGLLGRISKSKGHYFILDAARYLKKMKSSAFHFRFIGDAATKEESTAIHTTVAQNGLSDLIEFRGYRENIGEELAKLDLMVIPSVAEPFGRIICEAAEAKVPVLLSNSGGLGELSCRFNVGMRFVPENADDFLAKLNYTKENYQIVQKDFNIGADRLLKALDMKSYMRIIENLLLKATTGCPVAMNWFGESDDYVT